MAQRSSKRTNVRNRRTYDPSVPKKLTPAVIGQITPTGPNVVQVQFNTRVLPVGQPGFVAGPAGGQTIASVTQLNATTLEFTFTGGVLGSDLRVSEADPGVRTPSGGFVPAGRYAIPAA